MTGHVSTLKLHHLRYGELDPTAAAEARAHLAGCALCRRRLGVQEATRDEFVLRPVPEAIRAAAPRPAASPVPSWLRRLVPATALAAAALAFVAVPALREAGAPVAVEQTRTKGAGTAVEIWVERDGARALRDGDVLSAGDRIQVVYDPDGASHVTLAGRDPTGAVEVWATLTPDRDGLQPAPFALTLDETPGHQEVFVIRSPWPLTEGEVGRAVAGRPMPNGVTTDRVLLPKH